MAQTGGVQESTIQTALFQIEMGRGKKVIQWVLIVLVTVVLSLIYTAGQFHGFNKRESMDMAQLARNVARGEGYSTRLIRPLSIWDLEQHGWAKNDARLIQRHPDVYNPPLYPFVLAGLFKILPAKTFQFDIVDRIYSPERWVVVFDELCLLACVVLLFVWAQKIFDRRVAIMAAVLMLFSDTLWSYAVSGLPNNFLMLLVMLSIYCLYLADQRLNPPEPPEGEPAEPPPSLSAGVIALVLASAILTGLSFLTRYLCAFLLLPLAIYVARIFRGRAAGLWSGIYVVVFLVVITPWLVRNEHVSGSLLGIARFDLIDRTGPFPGEVLQRTYHPDLQGSFSIRAITSKFLVNARTNFITNLRLIGSDFLVLFFLVGLMYGFRRHSTSRLRRLLVGLIACAIFGMSLIGSDPEKFTPDVFGSNLLVLFLPLVAIFGVAFFFLLLDRIQFRAKLTRGAAIGVFVLLNLSPLIFTMLPPRKPMFSYPPYIPPITRVVADLFESDSLACSDLPWEMAWDGDRRTVWLPMTMDEFYEINDFVAPKGFQFMLFTPYLLDSKQQSELQHGEFKGWANLFRGALPSVFPLKAITPLPPNNEQILLADRNRWTKKAAEAVQPSATAATESPMPTNQPAAPERPTNTPKTPSEAAPEKP